MRPIVKERILEKYNHKCNYCGSKENLCVDHIIPLAKGGRHNEDNFQILCKKCNSKKKDYFPYDKFFKKGDGKNYILMSRELRHYLKYIKPNELISIVNQKFKEYCE